MGIEDEIEAHKMAQEAAGLPGEQFDVQEKIQELHDQMLRFAAEHQFEDAAIVRDEIARLRGDAVASPRERGRSHGGATRKPMDRQESRDITSIQRKDEPSLKRQRETFF